MSALTLLQLSDFCPGTMAVICDLCVFSLYSRFAYHARCLLMLMKLAQSNQICVCLTVL